jgi:hypothetical protein
MRTRFVQSHWSCSAIEMHSPRPYRGMPVPIVDIVLVSVEFRQLLAVHDEDARWKWDGYDL